MLLKAITTKTSCLILPIRQFDADIVARGAKGARYGEFDVHPDHPSSHSLRGPISHFSHILNTYNTCQGAAWANNMAFRNVCKIGQLRKE